VVAHLCNRRFGISGDGLILLENDPNLILKWCITTQMEVKAPVETEEDVWWLRQKN
jgi:hypothetical protein